MERLSRLDRTGPVPREALGRAAAGILGDFEAHIADNLNMPKALADLWNLVKNQDLGDGEKTTVLGEMDRVFGLDLLRVEEKKTLDSDIEALIQERLDARKNKNFTRADEIRDILKTRGILLEDGPDGTRWKRV
jgi:cysteinyl-tRNA synthetase